jgi:hypothetical protein
VVYPRLQVPSRTMPTARPVLAWTRAVTGKTRTRSLSNELANHYRPWFDNATRMPELVTALNVLTSRLQADLDHA